MFNPAFNPVAATLHTWASMVLNTQIAMQAADGSLGRGVVSAPVHNLAMTSAMLTKWAIMSNPMHPSHLAAWTGRPFQHDYVVPLIAGTVGIRAT
jgi:hypothetical protein